MAACKSWVRRLVDFAGIINPDASPAEEELEFVVWCQAHGFDFASSILRHPWDGEPACHAFALV